MPEAPDWEQTTYGDLRAGDVILPWNVEDVAINGEWRVTGIGPVPLRSQVEYATDRNPGWTRVEEGVPVRIRRRLADTERAKVLGVGQVEHTVPRPVAV